MTDDDYDELFSGSDGVADDDVDGMIQSLVNKNPAGNPQSMKQQEKLRHARQKPKEKKEKKKENKRRRDEDDDDDGGAPKPKKKTKQNEDPLDCVATTSFFFFVNSFFLLAFFCFNPTAFRAGEFVGSLTQTTAPSVAVCPDCSR
ncbi:hypothetical protein B0H13DRAFT_1881556 [Mycena leptocephala]|nr:hypothetical protein B0H13DRAFT_1881556 [Mycena leptocephala]